MVPMLGFFRRAVNTVSVYVVSVALITMLLPEDAASHCADRMSSAIRKDALYVAPSEAAELPRILAKYGIIRLKPGGDYRGSASLTLRNGHKIFGAAGTRIPYVFIPAGTRYAILRGVSPEGLVFLGSPSGGITRDNCFERIDTQYFSEPLTVDGAKLESNLFADISPANILIDVRGGGYLRNNRFIRVTVHSVSPSLVIYGDASRHSTNNSLIGTNILNAHGDGIYLENLNETNFIGLDAESWNRRGQATNPAMMTVRSAGTVRVFMPEGGDSYTGTGRYFDIGADRFEVFSPFIVRVGTPALTLQPTVQYAALVFTTGRNITIQNKSENIFEVAIGNSLATEARLNHSRLTYENPGPEDHTTLQRMFSPASLVDQWKPPKLPPIPDKLGPNWQTNLANKADSTDSIQRMINENGIAELKAGNYYISRPIILLDGQGVIGDGEDKTAIIAKDPNMDMFLVNTNAQGVKRIRFVLADLTLQGGRNGLRLNAHGAQFNNIWLSHVTFRLMSESGILSHRIYGWDNNFIDNLKFYRCGTGIKQRPDPNYVGGDSPIMTYFDKNVFYRCQFVENGRAVDFLSKRGNHMNIFVDSLFRNNTKNALWQEKSQATIFVNTDFDNNGGNPSVQSEMPVGFVNSRFKAGNLSEVMLRSNSLCHGCTFKNVNAKRASVLKGTARAYFINSLVSGMTIGDLYTGFLLNSSFEEFEDNIFNDQGAIVNDRFPNTLLFNQPSPVPILLPSFSTP